MKFYMLLSAVAAAATELPLLMLYLGIKVCKSVLIAFIVIVVPLCVPQYVT